MNSCLKILAAIAGTFLSLVTIDINSAQAGNFTFTKIVDDRDFFEVGGGSINDNGTVAFAAFGSTIFSGGGIFTSNGDGAYTTVVKFDQRTVLDGLAIDNSGRVAFRNIVAIPEEGIFLSNGDSLITIATESDNLFDANPRPKTFNNNDTLVFTVTENLGSGEKIVTGNGGLLTTVVDTSGLFRFFDQSAAINDANVVAFQATLKDGRQGVFTIKDGTITTIADNTNFLLNGFSEVGINNTGTVIFEASRPDGEEGIFIGNGETITTIADTSSFFSNLSRATHNDNNQVAFNGTLRDGAQNVFTDGIFTGPDPVADKVIAIGDSLVGGTVTNLFFSEGINNSGQISFLADIIDDSGKTIRGLYRADPLSKSIPESTSTLGLLAFGALGTGLTLKGKLKQKSTVRRNSLTYTI